MQAIRTIVWVVLAIVLAGFVAINWEPATVNLWPRTGLAPGVYPYFYVKSVVGLVAIAFFLLGLLPTWLLHRAAKWRLNRRIATLENTVKATTVAPAQPPLAPSTQLDAARTAEPPPL